VQGEYFMSADLDLITTKVVSLSVDELLTLQAQITDQLRHRINPNKPLTTPAEREAIWAKVSLPKPTPEQLEADLAAMFPPELRAEFGKVDLRNKVIGPKSASEMVNEDREDRI
jgi:hypothetical protein